MTTEKTGDDFEAAFAQFSAPEGAAPAAAAATDDKTPAVGGQGDGSGDAGAAAAGGEPAAAGDAGGGDGGAGAAAGAESGAAPADGAKTPEAGGDGSGAGESGAAPAGEAPAAAPVATPASEAVPNADDVLAQLSKLVAETKPAEVAAETKPAPVEAKPVFSDDEKAQLAAYDKDWPDVAKFESLKRRGEYQELMGFIFGEVQKYVQPLMEQIDSLAGRTHLTDVKTAVPDYSDNLRQQVVDWAAKQPAYLQVAYNHVIQQGTVDEVKDLVDRFRQATGQVVPAAGAAPTGGQAQRQPKDNELSGAAKEAAAALAPVESKRSEVINSGDPSSFEDAWSQFAKDLA